MSFRSLIGEEIDINDDCINTTISDLVYTKNLNKEVFLVEGVLNYLEISVSDTIDGEYTDISDIDILCDLDTYSGDKVEKYLRVSLKKDAGGVNLVEKLKNLRKRFFLKIINSENETEIINMLPKYVGDLEVVYTNEYDKELVITVDNVKTEEDEVLEDEIYPDKNGTFLLSKSITGDEEIIVKLKVSVDEFFDDLDEIINNGYKYNFAFEFFALVIE